MSTLRSSAAAEAEAESLPHDDARRPARLREAEEAERSAPHADQYRAELSFATGQPFWEGNEVQILKNGDRIFPPMLEAIEQAERTIDFVTFVYWKGKIAHEMAHAFARAAERGVVVRVLLDAIGAKTIEQELLDEMVGSGVKVRWYRPTKPLKLWRMNHRTHRKVLVCDGRVGFIGGVGIAKEWEGDARDSSEWRDTHVRLRGPAVNGLSAAFWANWLEMQTDDFPFPDHAANLDPVDGTPVQIHRSNAAVGWNATNILVKSLIGISRRRLRVTTAYFSPHPDTVQELLEKRREGVEIEILLPGPHTDSPASRASGRHAYEELLGAGIRIYEYLPTFIHAKVITVDGVLASVGSANLNHRSLARDEEANLVLLGEDLTAELDRQFDDDVAQSRPIDLRRWGRRSLWQRLKEWLVLPFRHEF